MDNWDLIVERCENAREWVGRATREISRLLEGYEKGAMPECQLIDWFELVTDRLVKAEREALTCWALDTGENVLPDTPANFEFGGLYDNKPTTLGHCMTYPGNYRIIELSKNIMIAGNGELIMNVLAHEGLHAILDRHVAHGHEFVRGAEILNHALGLNIHIKIRHCRVINKFKYVIYCPHCHEILKYCQRRGRMVKNPENYYHAACHTTLKAKAYTEKYMVL